MSKWTHPLCGPCWDELNPDREPHVVNVLPGELDTCCRCGYPTRAGIYVRADPASMEHCEGHRD